jgi:RNA polymerase sigma-70 factor (ECF subfamily)
MEPARQLPPDASVVSDLLVERARRGDGRAFEELYRLASPRIYALALRLTRDPGRARELTQDVFVRAWEILPRFRGESAWTTWLHGLAVRVFCEQSRAERRRLRWLRPADPEDEAAAYLAEVKRAMPETALDLERAIAALPPGARTVLVLQAVEGYRYAEIARLLDLAVGTVKAQIHRARRLLMEALKS